MVLKNVPMPRSMMYLDLFREQLNQEEARTGDYPSLSPYRRLFDDIRREIEPSLSKRRIMVVF